MEFINNLRIANSIRKLIKDPTLTDEIFKISSLGRRSRDQRPFQVMQDSLMKHPELVAQFERQYLPSLPTFADLEACAPGTLGEAYLKHLRSNGLQPDFFPPEPTVDIVGFGIMRIRQQHDIWHVLTGYGTSVPEEVALQSFTIAQVENTLSAVLVSGGMYHLARRDPVLTESTLKGVAEGYQMGKKAAFLIEIPWEENLHMSLKEARTLAGITPTGGDREQCGEPHQMRRLATL